MLKVSFFFRSKRQYYLFKLLFVSTVFDCGLIIARMIHMYFENNVSIYSHDWFSDKAGFGSFIFLIWNLFLAWIPYLISIVLDAYARLRATPSVIVLTFLFLLWLLFFPNAPYIITDLLHLKNRHNIPHWYDLLLIMSFVWTGLILGYCSLFEIQRFLERYFKRAIVWAATFGAIWLGGFGVYMGRYQRWNSWDAFTHPFAVLKQQIIVLLNPADYFETLGLAIVLSAFMTIGYLTLNALRKL